MKYDISFIGLGKLGLPLATNFAIYGRKVLAIDLNEFLLEQLNKKVAPWIEPSLQENIDRAADRITYTNSYDQVADSKTTIILVNTPSVERDGSFSNEYVINSLKSTCEALVKSDKTSHNFVLSSTVMPGSIQNEFIPLIEDITGWKLGKEFNFSYVPDFVAIGNVINDFRDPDFFLVGANTDEVAQDTFQLYSCMLKLAPPTSRVNLQEAELAKVALNAYITTKISFANYLGMLAEKLPNVNVDNVTEAIGQDRRIGTRYFKAGAPYGGTCFPRDTWAFLKVSNKVGMFAEQMAANEKINNDTLNWIASKLGSNPIVGLVGLGFKPGTSVTTEGLAEKLLKMGMLKDKEVIVYDKFADSFNNLSQDIDQVVTLATDLENLLEVVDTVILCNGDSVYDYKKIPSDINVIDPWRIL
jgi:UDPglucose 6-dehydrogenase